MLTLEAPLFKDFQGQSVPMTLMIGSGELKQARNQNWFWYGTLYDKFSQVSACLWEFGDEINRAKPGQIVDGMFKVKEFKGKLQLDLLSIKQIRDPQENEMSNFVRCSEITREIWMDNYKNNIEPLIEDEPIKQLLRILLDGQKFWIAPAAQGNHHNLIGGLAEHTYTILLMYGALTQAGHPHIDLCRKSLVIAGIILHDFGKVWDYDEVAPGLFEYSRYGDLVGHLAGGPIFFAKLMASKGIKMSKELELHFNHVLLAHHGQLDWGSPIVPHTKEAMLVHLLDMIDGKLYGLSNTDDGVYNRMVGGRVRHFTEEDSSA